MYVMLPLDTVRLVERDCKQVLHPACRASLSHSAAWGFPRLLG